MPRNMNWSDTEAVERWLSARPTRNVVIEYLRDGFDFGDMYASTVGVLFAIADVITEIDPALVPSEWEFRQSPFGADTDAPEYQAIIEAMRNDGATLEDIEFAGRVFSRLDSMNRATGLEY